MSLDDKMQKLTEDLNEEFEPHCVEISSSYIPNEKILTVVIDYPLASSIKFYMYRVPTMVGNEFFNEIKTQMIEDTDKYIRVMAKIYDEEYK